MLKPADTPPAGSERPIGELVTQLVDEGKAYARAEADLAKAIATAKVKAFTTPLILFAAALFVGMAALNALAVGIVLALYTLTSPLLAAIIGFVLIAAVAGLLAWIGVTKLRKAL
jgi:hypothetical protein